MREPPRQRVRVARLDQEAGAAVRHRLVHGADAGRDRHHAEALRLDPSDDMKRALDRIQYQLKPLDIVLVNTTAGKAYGQPDFIDRGCGFGREATLFLLNQGVRVTGTNGWSWDAPFSFTAKRFAETGDASIIWEGHKAGREIGYCHMEKLSNLDALPDHGFKVACFPVKIEKASAGWTRAVAIIE